MADYEPPRLSQLISFIRRHRFGGLLAALLVLFLNGAIVDLFGLKSTAARVTLAAIVTMMLLFAVFSVSTSRRTFRNAMLFGVPAIVAQLLGVVFFSFALQAAGHLVSIVFLGYVILILLGYIFATDRVTTNTIFASLCIYLLIGTFWAMAFSLLDSYRPNSFWYSLAAQDAIGAQAVHPIAIGATPAGLEFYYSFVTMTTLGYGDIVPVSSAARGLATLEAVVGQLYLAVLVARLVGLHVAESAGRGTS